MTEISPNHPLEIIAPQPKRYTIQTSNTALYRLRELVLLININKINVLH